MKMREGGGGLLKETSKKEVESSTVRMKGGCQGLHSVCERRQWRVHRGPVRHGRGLHRGLRDKWRATEWSIRGGGQRQHSVVESISESRSSEKIFI